MKSTNIEAEIYKALNTSKKIANDTPDLLYLSFSTHNESFTCSCFKVFNDDKIPFFKLFISSKEKLSVMVSEFLLSEKTRFRFEATTDKNSLEIEESIRKEIFKDWFYNKIKNVNQRDEVRVQMALDKIK